MYKKATLDITNKRGHVYSVDTNGVVVNETTGHILKGRVKNGYHLVCINQKYHPVHRIVAGAFIDKESHRNLVNHIDGHKSNNVVSNLEWCTHKENMIHARDTGLMPAMIGIEHGRCRTTETEVNLVCSMLSIGLNWKNIKHKVTMTRSTYLNIRRKATWKHISCQYSF